MPSMAQRKNVMVIRQQQNDPRPSPKASLNLALAISLGLVALVAILLIFYVLRRSRERNKVQATAASAAQRLRESQISSSVPRVSVNDATSTRGMRSMDSYGTWRSGQRPTSVFGEPPVLPRDDINISGPMILPSPPRISSTIIMSRPLPDAPTTALYSTGRESAGLNNSQPPPNLTRRSVAMRSQVPQDVNDSGDSNNAINFSRFSSHSDSDQSQSPKVGGVTSASTTNYDRTRVQNPFAQQPESSESDYFDGTFTASSIVGDKEDRRISMGSRIRGEGGGGGGGTIGSTRSSVILTSTNPASRPTSIIPSIPPLPRMSITIETPPARTRHRHSDARPSLDIDGVPISLSRSERGISRISFADSMKGLPTPPPQEKRDRPTMHQSKSSSSSTKDLFPQDMKRRGQLRATSRRKERPVSLMVPAIPRRMDVIITASPGPS